MRNARGHPEREDRDLSDLNRRQVGAMIWIHPTILSHFSSRVKGRMSPYYCPRIYDIVNLNIRLLRYTDMSQQLHIAQLTGNTLYLLHI